MLKGIIIRLVRNFLASKLFMFFVVILMVIALRLTCGHTIFQTTYNFFRRLIY